MGGAALGFLFGLVLLASVAAPKGLTPTAALLTVPCVAAACLQVSRKAVSAGLLWSVSWSSQSITGSSRAPSLQH